MRLSKKMVLVVLGLVFFPLIFMSVALALLSAPDPSQGSVTAAMILIMAAIVGLALGSILLLRWQRTHFSKPFKKLQQAAASIRDGNLDFELSADSDDEFSELIDSFEEMRLRLKNNAEERLRYEQDNKVLISNISHDLKTPITAIKGYVEGIQDGVASTPQKQAKYLSTIYDKADDMDKLVDQLAFYSLVDSNQVPYHFTVMHARQYFDECRAALKRELDNQNFVTAYDNALGDDCRMAADPEQLQRVISNVISNSVKYRDPAKGENRLEFRIRQEGRQILAEMQDNGIGIREEDIPHVFDRFYRSDTSRSAATGGNGIGLSIVKKIVEDHGGQVFLSSREGQGTRITMALPVYEEASHE